MKVINLIFIATALYILLAYLNRKSYDIFENKALAGDCAIKYQEEPKYGSKKWVMRSICNSDSSCNAIDSRGYFYICKHGNCNCMVDSPGTITWVKKFDRYDPLKPAKR